MQMSKPNPQTEADAHALLVERTFGHLAVNGPEGPMIALVPFLVESAPGSLSISTHLNRSHPMLSVLGDGAPAVLTCLSGDSYVSPDWYGLPEQVPTWIYDGVEARGVLRVMDCALTSDHLDRLSAQFEGRLEGKAAWTRANLSEKRWHALLRGLVPVELSDIRLTGLRKTAQAKPDAARRSVAKAMLKAGLPGAAAMAPLLTGSSP
ncbi:MAG: FMN-binding negative transcriptional regulator [Pseudomonadota bacterium]